MTCAEIKDLMPLVAGGLKDSQTLNAFNDHIAGCPACASLYKKEVAFMPWFEKQMEGYFRAERIHGTIQTEKSGLKRHKKISVLRILLPLGMTAALILIFITMFAQSHVARIGDRKIAFGETVKSANEPLVAVMDGKEITVKPNSEIKFISLDKVELQKGALEVKVSIKVDFTVTTKLARIVAHGTSFEVILNLVVFLSVKSGSVDISTDQGDLHLVSDESATVEPNKPPRKLVGMEKLRSKYPEIFKKIDSTVGLERLTAITFMFKYSSMTKAEKVMTLAWLLNDMDLDETSITTIVYALYSIKASGKDVENAIRKLLSHKSANIKRLGYIAAGWLELKNLKIDLLELWRKEGSKEILTFAALIGFDKADFEQLEKSCPDLLWNYVFHTRELSQDTKEYFAQLLEKQDVRLVAAGVMGIKKLKATEYKNKLLELANSDKASQSYFQYSPHVLSKLIIESLIEWGDKADVNEIAKLLDHKDFLTRSYAISGLVSFGAKQFIKEIGRLVDDRSEVTCLFAMEALAKFKAKEYSEIVLYQLKKRDFDPSSWKGFDYWEGNNTVENKVASILSMSIKELLDKSKVSDLIEIYKKMEMTKYSMPTRKKAVLPVLVEWNVVDVTPVLLNEFRSLESEVSAETLTQEIISKAISKLGNLIDHADKVCRVMRSGNDFTKAFCIEILSKWKAKECADQVSALLNNHKIGLRALEFLIDNNSVTEEIADRVKSFFKDYLTNRGNSSIDVSSIMKKIKSNRIAYDAFIEAAIDRIDKDPNFYGLWLNDHFKDQTLEGFYSSISDSQKKKIEELVLEKLDDGCYQLAHLIDYNKYKNTILKSAVKSISLGRGMAVHYMMWLDPQTKQMMERRIDANTFLESKNRAVQITDLIDGALNAGFKIEFKLKDKINLRTHNTCFVSPETTLTDLFRVLQLQPYYPILEYPNKIIVFESMNQVEEYFKAQIKD